MTELSLGSLGVTVSVSHLFRSLTLGERKGKIIMDAGGTIKSTFSYQS